MTDAELFVWIGAFLVSAGGVRMLLVRDLYLRLVALNVAASGGLVVLVALASRTDPPDPVLHALALTGIVITICVTGVGLVLARHVEVAQAQEAREQQEEAREQDDPDATTDTDPAASDTEPADATPATTDTDRTGGAA